MHTYNAKHSILILLFNPEHHQWEKAVMSKKWNIYGKPTTKQRKRPDAIMFDEESRRYGKNRMRCNPCVWAYLISGWYREFLTGFHSRKVKRQKLAQQEIQKQSKEARKQQKAEVLFPHPGKSTLWDIINITK